jgi:predicted PurR-regulated permease PerM
MATSACISSNTLTGVSWPEKIKNIRQGGAVYAPLGYSNPYKIINDKSRLASPRVIMNNKNIIPAFLATLLITGGVLLFYYQSAIFLPIFIALLLAYIFNPLVTMVEKRWIGRTLAIALVFCTVLALIAAITTFFAISIRGEFQDIRINLPEYANRIYGYIPQWLKVWFGIETPAKLYQQINATLESIRSASADIFKEAFIFLKKAFASTLSFILALLGYVLTPIYLYYFLKDLPQMKRVLRDLTPERYRQRSAEKAGEIHEILSAFVRGQLSVCAILAVLYSIGLYFIGIDLAIATGALAGITFIIPYFGFILGIVLSMTLALLKFHDLLHPLLCLGWFAIVQGVEGGIITPRIVGEKVGLHPVVTILAILIGGQLFGILGMLLAVPVTAVLKVGLRSLIGYYRSTTFFTGV